MAPIVISFIAFAIIFGGALGGLLLPGHHLPNETKDVVRGGAGLVATIAGLVLGLLIASANSSYDTQGGQVRRMAADLILLDELLAEYGPDTHNARELLRKAVGPLVGRIWRTSSSIATNDGPFRATAVGESANLEIEQLSPQNDVQRSLKTRAIQVATDLAQTRLLLFENADSSIPTPFLVILVVWLGLIFFSFGLFARGDTTAIAALFIFALSASCALFLILELNQPFTGLLQISNAPLLNALTPLTP